ncbi:MAG TPA: TIGR03435 family protein, partial [Bryobacteraceae bacterium]|nr:TIGR03435 family protein [Bryobacteraceae bacterium]
VPNKAPCLVIPGVGKKNAPSTPAKSDAPLLPWPFYPEQISIYADRPVIDETGLEGDGYCTADGADPFVAISFDMYSGASVFTAVEEKWGMKLEPKKASVDVVVIDKVERPSEN